MVICAEKKLFWSKRNVSTIEMEIIIDEEKIEFVIFTSWSSSHANDPLLKLISLELNEALPNSRY